MLLPRYDQDNGETMNHFIVSETLLSYIMTNNTLMEKYFVFVHQLDNTPLGIACKKFYSIIYCIWKKKRFSKIIIHIVVVNFYYTEFGKEKFPKYSEILSK